MNPGSNLELLQAKIELCKFVERSYFTIEMKMQYTKLPELYVGNKRNAENCTSCEATSATVLRYIFTS